MFIIPPTVSMVAKAYIVILNVSIVYCFYIIKCMLTYNVDQTKSGMLKNTTIPTINNK